MCQESVSTLRILHKTDTRINIINEGTSNEPNGNTSNYNINWILIDSSNKEGNLTYDIGNFISNGESCKLADPLPIIGNNTEYIGNESSSRDIGLLFQRYQKSNDIGEGDIVEDVPNFTDTIPDQSTASPTQIKLSNAANSNNDYYKGWWIKINSGSNLDQVRRIVSYNGSLRIAEIDKPWTTQNPGNATNISLYNFAYYSIVFEEQSKKVKFIITSSKSKNLNKIDYISIDGKSITLYDTTSSLNSSTGTILTYGGITINNTNNATSSTSGGTFTTLGGGCIKKNLYVGENIGIGDSDFTIDESLHIKQQRSNIKLENESNEYSYIDFEETGNNSRFGIMSKISAEMLNFTYNTISETPNNSNSALTIMNNGNIGINTTDNINSTLTFKKDSIISLTENNGYIAILAGSGNNISNNSTTGSSIILYGSDNSGDIVMNTGTLGNFSIYTQDVKNFNLDKDGIVNIYSTKNSLNATSGAFCVKGGISIQSSQNSISYTSGGALTVGGGVSIKKDTYIEGDLYVKGNITYDTLVDSSIVFSDFVNCTLNTYGNNSISRNGTQVLLAFYVELYPINSSQNCQVEFELPEKINNLNNRMDLIATCNGYSDNTELIPLFNTLCVGKPGSNKGIIKFQSNSLNLHYISIICKYNL